MLPAQSRAGTALLWGLSPGVSRGHATRRAHYRALSPQRSGRSPSLQALEEESAVSTGKARRWGKQSHSVPRFFLHKGAMGKEDRDAFLL